ncbi:ABC transporter [Alkalilimnicola ehrlichii]|uniref:ABC transporter n=1 Tax=Alkalilimnicola ehrlichii TaxID=351052 RepID=A0A3E0WZW8_9GAMM|nr:ABC transporter ATP-binding protein [Alkalilimnicola ehrlichii]RFA29001.1 ABC transporter [Alkalilimnicola ehrlichii]RFA38637.1 ABC transporter [Alkalilimnicola ehrlichii]
MTQSGFAVNGLSAGYRGRKVLLDVSIETIPSHSLVALVGPNAAGKSTLLKAIVGLAPARGEVWLDGDALQRLTPAQRLRRAGYLPQTLPQACSLTAYESLLSALRAGCPELTVQEAEHNAESTLDLLELRPLALRRMDQLSGGQRQMVGLAQVIARQPRMLLLDEPTSALDLRWQVCVLEAVRQLARARGAIALIAIHDLNLALRFCDRVLVLDQGKVLASGTPANFQSDLLEQVYGVEGRLEHCSHGHPLVVVDRAL